MTTKKKPAAKPQPVTTAAAKLEALKEKYNIKLTAEQISELYRLTQEIKEENEFALYTQQLKANQKARLKPLEKKKANK